MAACLEQLRLRGGGPFTERCEQFLEEALAAPRVLLTTSCTDALEMASILLGVQPGDEVIVPAFAYVSTASAFVLHGAAPVFVDVRPDTLNLDEQGLADAITPRTRAVVLVHYGGVACNLPAIQHIASDHGIAVVEDNAHGLFGSYAGQPLGTFGAFGAQSFHETKNLTCGEGGALVVNDEEAVARAESVRVVGTYRPAGQGSDVEDYQWTDYGSSFLPADVLAAFLWAQLESQVEIQGARRALWNRYDTELAPLAAKHGVQTPVVPESCEHPAHQYALLLRDAAQRTALARHLSDYGVGTSGHYTALNVSPFGQRNGGAAGQCPVAESVGGRMLRLPLYPGLDDKGQQRVIAAVQDFFAA